MDIVMQRMESFYFLKLPLYYEFRSKFLIKLHVTTLQNVNTFTVKQYNTCIEYGMNLLS